MQAHDREWFGGVGNGRRLEYLTGMEIAKSGVLTFMSCMLLAEW